MRDVREKGGLGAVDFGQGFGALAFLFVSAGVGDGRGDVAGGEFVEAAIIVIGRQARADSGDQETGGKFLRPGFGEWQRNRALRPIVRPCAGGQPHVLAEPLRQVFDNLTFTRLDDAAEVPNVIAATNGDRRGTRFRSGGEVDHLIEARLPAVLVEQINQREWEIVLVLGERGGGGVTSLFGGLRFLQTTFAEVTQSLQPPLSDHTPGGFADGGENAADASRLVADGRIRPGEISLLDVTVAVDEQQPVVRPRGFPRVHHALEHRPDHVPDFGPNLTTGAAQRAPVLVLAKNRSPSVIVYQPQFRPPPDDHREFRVQADADRRAQALRPLFNWTERRQRPIHLTNQFTHLAAAGQPVGARRRHCLFTSPVHRQPHSRISNTMFTRNPHSVYVPQRIARYNIFILSGQRCAR